MLKIILSEAWFRRTTSLLLIAVIALAVAMAILFRTMAVAGENQTRIIQRDLGLNVVILPESMTLDRYWTLGYSDRTLPAEYLTRLSDQAVANRLVPMLRRQIAIDGVEAMLTGIGAEVFKGNKKMKPVYGMEVPSGSVVLGAEVADALGAKRDGTLDIHGETFTVKHVLARGGSDEDIRIYGNLADVQRLLKLEGRLGEIQALECHCSEGVDDPFALLQKELTEKLPETRVVRRESLAEGRRQQRLMAERYAAWTTTSVIILSAGLIAALSALNVRERRRELGVYHALGFGTSRLASIFMGRVFLLGLLGAIIGCAATYLIVSAVGPRIYKVSSKAIELESSWIIGSLVIAPLFAAICASIPAFYAATLDPVEVLHHE